MQFSKQATMVDIIKLSTISLLFFLVFSAITLTSKAQAAIKQCEYEMVVSTGPTRGPNFKFGVVLEAIGGTSIRTGNLIKNWGDMGPKHTYFLPNSFDRFKTILPCLPDNFCWIAFKGKKGELVPHWYINNVTVATKGEGGVDRLKTFRFLFENEVKSLYPDFSDGECP